MGSTREEVGGSGAKVGSFANQPDCCVAVDVTFGRSPEGPKDDTFPLGKGPTIGIGPSMTRWMSDRMIAKAKEREIPWQAEVIPGNSGTNAWHIQVAREGIPTSLLSIPLRYMHTPNEMLDVSDIEYTAQLLAAFIAGLGGESVWMG